MATLDDINKSLLNRIQSDFPITSRPYQAIADDLGLTEKDVLDRIQLLEHDGIIRRIGANFVPGKLGYVSTLCAAKVPEEKIELFAQTVNRYTGVTHHYLRKHDLNIWFTFIAPSMETINQCLGDISRQTEIKGIYNLPATKVFKVKAQFGL